ncbi:MAG: DUF1223 domain-containing protein [Rhizobiales bacterium]|nr:DUF1223 domain-containing protein [Hyphomicrobiales bacterium]MBN9009367.1 DUF1223 domain-containing protein [Hyphomicrobiales bacterium]
MLNSSRLAFVTVALCGAFASSALAEQPRAVLELFTSQGCSSCPPADKLLGELAQRKDILALSLPVDYWDYLGWKDTLANHDFSERQKEYATARGDSDVFTPQMVINGGGRFVGSDKAAIESALTQAGSALPVPIDLASKPDATTVTIGAAGAGTPTKGTIWLVMYERAVTVPIVRGENSGKTVTYTNVVRKLRPIAMWKGAPLSIDLPKSEVTQAKVTRCAVLLQAETETGLPGAILGASTIYYGH